MEDTLKAKKLNKDLITVVVPIYKVEAYLEMCVDSILNQTYTNLEIILVDDGSPDQCPSMCDSFAKKDNRVSVIHKKNGGLSDARNAGLAIAKGKYITFVDSDDMIDLQFVSNLYNAIIENNSDIAFCDYKKIDENTFSVNVQLNGKTTHISNVNCLQQFFAPKKHGFEFVAWGKLYKRELFEKYKICYPVGKLHEDIFTTYKLCYFSHDIVFSDSILYFYRIRTGSIMTSKFDIRRLHQLEAWREACLFYAEYNEKKLYDMAYNALLRTILNLYVIAHKSGDRYSCSIIIKELRKELKKINQTDIRVTKKMFYKLFSVFPSIKIYKVLIKRTL